MSRRPKLSTLILIFSATILLSFGRSTAGTIKHYDIEAQLLPEKGELQANVTLTCVAPEGGLKKLDLLLNRGLNLRSVSADVRVKGFTFDRTQPSPYRYTQPASPLLVEFGETAESGKTITVRLSYDGTIEPDPFHTNVLTPDWVELALYAAWYPVDPDSGSTTSRVKVKVAEPYRVTGTGTLSQTADGWQLTQSSPTFDIVVIAARNLGVRRIGDDHAGVEVWYKNLTEEQVDQIAGDITKMVDSFGAWLGRSVDKKLKLVFVDRVSGGGYYRSAFITLIYDKDYRGLAKYAAHEVAHFWWSRGSATTWQDWLNESFAEYSALLFIRESFGAEAFQEYLKQFATESEKTPPIWGLDRNDKAAHAVLYRKGPVLLSRLEERIGKDAFHKFLRTLVTDRVSTTDQMLATLENLTSKDVRQVFEAGLKE